MTNCNSGEMFPGAATPLTISVFGEAVDWGMQAGHCLRDAGHGS